MTPDSIDSTNYFYAAQLEKYITQFMDVFSGFKIKTGKNDYDTDGFIHAPVVYASMDKVVAHIKSGNTQNIVPKFPVIAVHMTGIEMAPDFNKGLNQEHRHTVLPVGGSWPNDGKVIRRLMPLPWVVKMEVTMFTSNINQRLQLLEQILLLFTPSLQIYKSTEYADWTKITTITMEGLSLDETVPAENSRRILTTTMQFQFIAHISAPADVRDDYVKSIRLRLETVPTFGDVNETLADTTRTEPPYKKLFDIEDYDIPPN